MRGYLNDPLLTKQTIVDHWMRSGDLAYQDSDGVYWFAGRKKDLIVLRSGDTVSPLEIERAILQLPEIKDCIVVGIQSRDWSEKPWAFLTINDDAVTEQHISDFLKKQLSDFKLPTRYIFLDHLPCGSSGKISRKTLRQWWHEQSL